MSINQLTTTSPKLTTIQENKQADVTDEKKENTNDSTPQYFAANNQVLNTSSSNNNISIDVEEKLKREFEVYIVEADDSKNIARFDDAIIKNVKPYVNLYRMDVACLLLSLNIMQYTAYKNRTFPTVSNEVINNFFAQYKDVGTFNGTLPDVITYLRVICLNRHIDTLFGSMAPMPTSLKNFYMGLGYSSEEIKRFELVRCDMISSKFPEDFPYSKYGYSARLTTKTVKELNLVNKPLTKEESEKLLNQEKSRLDGIKMSVEKQCQHLSNDFYFMYHETIDTGASLTAANNTLTGNRPCYDLVSKLYADPGL